MEMWLRQAEDRFRFPVFPSSFSINGKAAVNSSSILKIGEIATFGGVALKSISISSFFQIKTILSVTIQVFHHHMIV
ncbi:hypothetical protein ACK2IE_17930 [Clostridioides difficile]